MAQEKVRGDRGSALVVGAGIAGMQSALLLAEMGTRVFLLEQGPAIGGYFPLLDKTFPTNSCGVCFMSPTPPAFCPIYECRLHDNIELLPYSEVVGVDGEGGTFRVSVLRKPRRVDSSRCTLCEACVKACPVEVEREFGGGLEKRKAIYLPFPQAIPQGLVIDPKTCTRCGECVRVCGPGAIDLDQKEETETIHAGAIVLGVGFEPFSAARKGEYGFGRYANVLTSVQFERMLSTSSPSQGMAVRVSDGRRMERVAFIQCVGSRDPSCGQDHCSTICCMYATKQAMIAKDRCPDLRVTVFYMDIRPVGKDYERYYERARDNYGIEFKRCAISSLKEVHPSKNLLATYVREDGVFEDQEFDGVVLSLGVTPPRTVTDLAGKMGLLLNPQGFCKTDEFHPAETSIRGVFVAGAFRNPSDIPESVVEGSSAAAAAAALLLHQQSPVPVRAYPEEGGLGREHPKVGVFLCHCGQTLTRTLSLPEILEGARALRGVAHVEALGLACLPEDLDRIKRRVGEQGLNRLVLAGCSRWEIRAPVEEMAKGMGFNPALIEYANIREQCAFVHEAHPKAATEKARALIRMAVERARRIQPSVTGKQTVQKRGVVVGGGLSGLTASLRLADLGYEVVLVEKTKDLGGNLRESFYTLRGSKPQVLLEELIRRVNENPNIHLRTEAEVVGFGRVAGGYRTMVRQQGEDQAVDHGTLILATGGREVIPKDYLFGKDYRVMTQRQLEKMISLGDECLKEVHSVAMIQCVGSREAEHPYCSRVCCGHAVKNAIRLKERDPGTQVYVLYRDVRTYGFAETFYQEARARGVLFIRYDLGNKPIVTAETRGLQVSLFDPVLGNPVNLRVDRVVLSAGIEPSDNRELAKLFQVALNPDGFFEEANPKAAPLDSVDRGKFFCGLCHSPNHMEEAISQGNAVAARAAAFLSRGMIEEKPHRAYVTKRLCCGCGLCVNVCPYGARILNEEEGKAEVIGPLCQGCGSCVIACRNTACQQHHFEKELNLAVLDAALD